MKSVLTCFIGLSLVLLVDHLATWKEAVRQERTVAALCSDDEPVRSCLDKVKAARKAAK